MDNQAAGKLLQVKIISPKEKLFEGVASSVSSQNLAGNFDILPSHANFLTIVRGVPITIRTPDKGNADFHFPLAIIFAKDNKVNIYTDIQLEFGQK